ncbi:hypothetical protein [Asticcacaulis sp.]|jgi:cell division septal protein FtsQ|uniref:hypothetical protein n=1 Tax=unclassified Asticcacaulis TaxID=2628350 RepID=UPI0025B9C4E1|nr:hypothetical protein [Asticcacaulis sp.]MCA1935491.1 hypothetical protein [Asticcacaulis sp.]
MNWMQADKQYRKKRFEKAEQRRKAMMQVAVQIALWSGTLGGMAWLASLALLVR